MAHRIRPLLRQAWLACGLLACCLLAVSAARADNGVVQDDRYVVYYNTLNTRDIPAEVAARSQILRSRERGLLTIAVQRKQSSGAVVSVSSLITGSVRRGNTGGTPLEFDMAQDNGYISYTAPFVFPDGQALDFDVQVKPAADHPGFTLRFSSTLFAED